MAEPEEGEDLLDVGPATPPRFEGRSRLWPLGQPLRRLALTLVVATIVAVLFARSRHAEHDAEPSPQPSSRPAPTSATPSQHVVDEEYLIAVPAQDMRNEINRCGPGCVARSLTGAGLVRAAHPFPSVRPLSGGTVTRRHRLVLLTIEAHAGPEAIAHLLVRRAAASDPPTVATSTHTSAQPGYLTTTVDGVHNNCRFTAVLVTRVTAPPVANARAWVRASPLSCG